MKMVLEILANQTTVGDQKMERFLEKRSGQNNLFMERKKSSIWFSGLIKLVSLGKEMTW